MDNDSKVIRAPSLRRGKNDERLCDRIKLKKVLGLTVCSNAALDVSPTNGVLAYPAGCTVVLFNTKKLTQSYLLNTSRKAITAVAYSQCGRYVATGECGINPAIKVWELEPQSGGNSESNAGGTVVAEFLGHKYAISCVAFSPTGKYLVSVGSQHDMIVNVFDWKLNLKIASNKVSAKVAAVCFSEDGNYFVTVGNRHVKYWYLEGSRKYKEPIPLMGRSAILGELRNNDFCAVACGKGECSESTYAITRVGHLVEFNSRRLLDKWVACRTTLANCICVNTNYILVGCAESIVRIFNAATLEYITTLPRTHYLGVDVAQGIHINHIMAVPANAKYPDTIAMVFDEGRSKVTCVYNDHSLYIWDLRDIRRVGKSHSFLYHSACIWGVETVPYNLESNLAQTLPEDSFLTCSSDDTIRVWGLDGCGNNEIYRKNIYSKELLKVIYIDDELNFIKDVDNPILSTDKSSSYDGRNGVRCIKISPERNHLATGDRSGNIRIYNLSHLKLLTMIEAHDSEVLCLEYTNDKIDKKLLASASRDRLIHVFDVNQGYKILQTLDDHSSSITSVKFIGAGMSFQMISCGADKSIMFRNFQNNQFLRGTNCSGKTTLYDMEVDSNSKHILTACQDRNIRVYATQNSKHTKTFKGSHSDDGSLIKLCLDPSGIYIATSCTDKTLSVYDYYSNECMARMYGHSELVTGLKFTNDCKYLISASGDGCVFIWQVPHDMIVTMQARLSQQRLRSGHPPIARPISNPVTEIILEPPPPPREREVEKFSSSPSQLFMDDIPLTPGYKFSDVGQLPQWAKRKGNDENQMPALSSSPSQGQMIPKARGRWAQRGQIDSDALDFRSTSESPLSATYNISTNNNMQTSDYNSGSSKDIYNQAYLSEDSSIDSGMENRRDLFNAKLGSELKKSTTLRFEANNDNDGDVEDISDGERTSSDHGMMFYPTVAPGTPTDFKVNAMNEDELRKSVRRQKFEKTGLCLTTTSHSVTSGTGTGTGTSDTEDEGSTPSGENADRSLASTLGGSFESIPQQTSSSFLQAALDGPGTLPERGDRNRRSISAKHNTENKGTSFSKSYTNSKREELLKVINEAKQKLENVGYRSNLRGSQSISDLTHAGNSNINRTPRTGEVIASTNPNTHYYYFNCAAPKSILTQNCNTIRQLHRNYPPYPRDVGVYSIQQQQQQQQQQQCNEYSENNSGSFGNNDSFGNNGSSSTTGGGDIQAKIRPITLDLPSSDVNKLSNGQTGSGTATPTNTGKTKRNSSILKNYKSCPVSPVHEELEWSNLPVESKNIIFNEPKRHSMYSDDAKTILDMIHSDTEKMIEEITKKYGDLDHYQPETTTTVARTDHLDETTATAIAIDTSSTNPTISEKLIKNPFIEKVKKLESNEFGLLSEDNENFSSDSLEDCSLDLDLDKRTTNPFKKRRTVCKKHQRITEEKSKTLPKRSVSDYFIYEEFYQPKYRNVSLSDILNEENNDDNNKENQFLETQRHSSASFFLVQYPEQKSQESILSDDFSGISYYNSMESILSDESDCKSAPLEVLFNKTKKERHSGGGGGGCGGGHGGMYFDKIDNTSKSYGSSPNATNSFDCYMQQKLLNSSSDYQFDMTGYNLDGFYDNCKTFKPKSPRAVNRRNFMINSETFPQFPAMDCTDYDALDDIPTMSYKNAQYTSAVNKSISKEFANQRHVNNTNPLYIKIDNCDSDFFVRKSIPNPNKPAVPVKPPLKPLQSEDLACENSNVYIMKKSCSFEIEMKDGKTRFSNSARRFERNLEKFENDQVESQQSSGGRGGGSGSGTLEMSYVPHKPPVAARRSSSMRSRSRSKTKERYNTVDQINYCFSDKRTTQSNSTTTNNTTGGGGGGGGAPLTAHETRDFVNKNFLSKNVTTATKIRKNNNEEKSFEIYISEKGNNEDDNMDSLELYTKPSLNNSIDSLDESHDKHLKNSQNEKNCCLPSSSSTAFIHHTLDFSKFKDIEKKINVINKLVEFEEKKLEQEKILKENRMKPFECNSSQKGYVKSLTMNFDKLAKSIEEEIEFERKCNDSRIKRNYSLPDVLEGAKFQAFHCGVDDDDNLMMKSLDFCDDAESEKIKDDFSEKDKGNPKSLMSVHIDDSSIRRACSLSDLSMGKGSKTNSSSSSSQKPTPNVRSSIPTRPTPKRNSQPNVKSIAGMGTRSISVGVLNQSDSETDSFNSRGGILRPTVSSTNRSNNSAVNARLYNSKNNSANSGRRKGLQNSYSSVNLTTPAQDDSSSEEAQSSPNTHSGKPAIPPRPRSMAALDHKKSILSNSNVTKNRGNNFESIGDFPSRDNDNTNSDLTSHCSNIINMLNTTTNAVLQLHTRLKYSEESSGTRNNNLMLKELENAVIMTQNMLTRVTNNKTENNPHVSFASDQSGLENGDYLLMMNRCADILNKVRSKHKSDDFQNNET